MKLPLSPFASRAGFVAPLVSERRATHDGARPCRVWLLGEENNEKLLQLLLEECERLFPSERRFEVRRAVDVAETVAFEGDHLCLVWGAGAHEALEMLARARSIPAAPPVLVVLPSGEEDDVLCRVLELGASDCWREEELSAPLLSRSIRFALRSAEQEARLEFIGHDNARLALTLEATSAGMLMCGTLEEGCPISWVNPAFEQLTGYNFEEVRGRNPTLLEGEGTDPKTAAFIEEALRKGEEFQTVVLNFRRDQTPFWNEVRLNPVRDQTTGQVTGWFGHIVDVTARVRNAQLLEESRRDLEVAQRLTHLGSWCILFDPHDDMASAHVEWSDEFYRILEIERGTEVPCLEVMGRFVHPDDLGRVVEMVNRLDMPGEDIHFQLEHRLIFPDGRVKWVHARAEVERDATGKPLRVVGTLLDVSERVRDAERLRESERRTRAIVQNAPLVIWQLDAAGLVLSVQGSALRSIDLSPADLQGGSVFETVKDVPALQHLARRALNGEECEDTAWFGDRFFAVRYAPLPEGGALGVGVDMTETERVRLEFRESETRYASIVANVPGVVYRFVREANGECRFDFISKRARDVWGKNFDWDNGDFSLHIERIHPDDRDSLLETIEASARNLTPWNWTGRLLDASGGWKWARATAIPRARDNGAIVWDGLVTDETATRAGQAELERSRNALEEAQEIARVGSFDWNVPSGEVTWSDTMFRIHGYEPKSFSPTIYSVREHVHPDDLEWVGGSMERAIAHGGDSMLLRIHRADGQERFLQAHAHVEVDEQGTPIRYLGSAQDVTEQIVAERALRDSEERYALAARGGNDGLWDWNLRTNTIYVSPRWREMIGCLESAEEAAPDDWFGRVHPEDRPALDATLSAHLDGTSAHFECEYRLRHEDGEWKWMLGRGLAVRGEDGTTTRIAGSQTDISGRKHFESQLARSAFYDALTALPNRALFLDRLDRAIARAAREETHSFAVLFLDLDRFKNINDSLGHLAGDELLVEAGRRFESCLRPGDTVARLGGDEFAVLIEGVADESVIDVVATRIGRELDRPFQLEDHEVFVTVSIGVAHSQGSETRAVELLRNADTAMYRAKGLGRARHATFDTSMHQRAVRLLELESDLWRALERNELCVHYQPIVCLRSGKICAVEALVRWQHPSRGLVSPGEFIPLAEETGLIVPIGWWVLETACRDAAMWPRDLKLSVNLSSQQFSQEDLLEHVGGALKNANFDAHRLKLEITESVIMGNTDSANTLLRGLREMKVDLAMDDFGTGYSSLSYLHRFPIDTLKIDRSFVAQMNAGSRNDQIVRTILTLAHGLELTVVAEGIESVEQLDVLRDMGCDAAQGFFFARPMPLEQLSELLGQNPCW